MASNKVRVRVGFVSIVAPYFDSSYPREHYDRICEELRKMEAVQLVAPSEPVEDEAKLDSIIEQLRMQELDCLLLQMGTFNSGIMPVRLCQSFDIPIALWALKEPVLEGEITINSLCGVNLLSSALHSLGRKYTFFYSHPHEREFYDGFADFVKIIAALKRMSNSRVGSVGGRALGFYPCLYDEMKLRRVFGTEVLVVGLSEVFKYKVSADQIDAHSLPAIRTIEGGQLSQEQAVKQEMAFLTLKNFARAQGFDALTLRDWPELTDDPDIGEAVWAAVGRLHDEVMVTGPEGDMLGTITMMIEEYLTGHKPFLCDMVYFDDEDNTVVLWHYGAAESLARNPEDVRYAEDNREVEFSLREGPITMARLAETSSGYKMLIAGGQVLPQEMKLRRAGALVKLNGNASDVLEEIIYGGWAHHVCAVEGNQVKLLREFCRLMDIEVRLL